MKEIFWGKREIANTDTYSHFLSIDIFAAGALEIFGFNPHTHGSDIGARLFIQMIFVI